MSFSFGHRLVAGSVVGGDFTVERPLDEGGMGAVYVVAQRSTGKLRALKVMHREIVADPTLARRFEQEARVGARIASDHVVEVIAAGFDAGIGLPYLVMELESSTFESTAFSQCVVDVLIGQTMNGAGPDGKGHVTYGFRFVPMD